MGSNWKELTIDELKAPTKSAIAMGPFGSRIKAENFVNSGVPILKGGNLHKAFITEDKLDYLTVSKAEELKTSQAIRRDLVITHRGTIGQVSIIPDNSLHDKYIVSQSQLKVTLNQDLVNPYYVNYFFRSRLGQHRLLANSSQVGVPAIAKASTSVRSILVPCPDLKEQNKIVEILSSLDNKIELNNKTNQTLEQMAQALFKSWFVDFDPVFDNLLASVDFNLENLETSLPDELKQKAQRRLAALNSLHNAADVKASLIALAHELQALSATQAAVQAAETPVKPNFSANPNILAQHANTHAHFPNEFEHNEQLGWIPKGWEYGPFSKIAILKTESVHPKKSPDKLWSQFSLPAFDSGKTPTLDLGIEIKSGKYKLSNNVVLVSKLNPQTPRVWMPNVVDVESSVCSTEFMPFEPILEQHKPFIYALMSSKFIQTEIASRVTGTTGSHQRVSPKNIAVLDVILPSENCIKLYCEMVEPSFNKINLISFQSTKLTNLRETLLPKLISGELQIPDVATDE